MRSETWQTFTMGGHIMDGISGERHIVSKFNVRQGMSWHEEPIIMGESFNVAVQKK